MAFLRAALLLGILSSAAIAEEYRQPQPAAAYGQVAMTYGGGSTIYFARSEDGGKTFGPPIQVATTEALALGRHRGPRLTILKNSLLITAISGRDTPRGDLRTWLSKDQGKTWTAGKPVNDVSGAAREGLHAIVADAHDNLFAAWLDLRTPGMKLYGAKSTDGGATWSKNTLIYASPAGTICQCCAPSLTVDATGEITAMWRNVIDGNRDLYVATSKDGVAFSKARKLGTGSWQLNACPMDGGGIVTMNGKLISAWRRGTEIFLAEPGSAEQRLGTGKDVAIVAAPKGPVVVWSTAKGVEARLPNSGQTVSVAESGGFPALSLLADGSVLLAWEDAGKIQTRILN